MTPEELQSLFMPEAMARLGEVARGKRLVHYTSAEAAYRIVTNRQVWLRHVGLMNDYSEMTHGLTCLQKGWNSEAGERLRAWLDETWPGIAEDLQVAFNNNSDQMLSHTYITSLSEHDDEEDVYGRLSMWRAYGGNAGVALVLNTAAFQADTDALGVFSVPVTYLDERDFAAWFTAFVERLIAAGEALRALEREAVLGWFFWTFRLTVLATKHPGFAEEREWRVFHSAGIDQSSAWLTYEPEIIAGVPQPIVKLALRDDEEAGVRGVSPASLVDRVIIGPCESPLPIRAAMWQALEAAEVPDFKERVAMSFIPLRQRQ